MANDREEELQRLEKELLASIPQDDDLLSDIPIELLDTTPISWEDIDPASFTDSLEITPEDLMDYPQEPQEAVDPMKKAPSKKTKTAKKREQHYKKYPRELEGTLIPFGNNVEAHTQTQKRKGRTQSHRRNTAAQKGINYERKL